MMSNVFGLIIIIFVIAQSNDILDACSSNGSRFEMINTSHTKIDIEWFSHCSNVAHVNMSHNKFKTVQTSSFNSTNISFFSIKVIDLSYNEIEMIETGAFSNLFDLEHIYLHHNELVDIPLDFFKYKKKLKSVDFSYNNIKRIPLAVFSNFRLPNIELVELQYNQIAAFEPWAYAGNSIRLVNVSYNNISTFTNEDNWRYNERNVDNEETTDLRHNAITEWHDWYVMQYKNQSSKDEIQTVLIELLLDIRENNLTCDCNIYKLVTKVRGTFIQWLGHDFLSLTCYNPPHLRNKLIFYDISYRELVCDITEDCPVGCQCEVRPAESVLNIDCEHLNLKSMPSTLPKSPYNKIALHLGNNKITNIDDVNYLKYVSKLSMPNNSLTSLPDFVIRNMTRNKNAFVDFRHNSLTVIPKSSEKIKFENAHFDGNRLECSCDMLWMVDWIKAAPNFIDKRTLGCTFEGNDFWIIDLDESTLKCESTSTVLIVIMLVVIAIVVAVMVTVKRCPYETKVLLFKVFGIHCFDKYMVDENTDKCYDMYVSFDDNDLYVRQWVMKVLQKRLECKKPNYRLCIYARNAPLGPETEARLQLMDKSKRILFIMSAEFDKHKWFDYEIGHSETLEQNSGRIIYLLYDEDAERKALEEPWVSTMKERKVFKLTDRLLWTKLRYELPLRSNKKEI